MESERAALHAREMFASGASMVDVGAESTNPRSNPLDPVDEWQRLAPVLEPLLEEFPGQISVDTYHPDTAHKALILGAAIINDVTMFRDPAMVDVIVGHLDRAPRLIVSHLSPKAKSITEAHSMQPPPTTDIQEVIDELLAARNGLTARGVPESKIILDPGIGFGKPMFLNWQLLGLARLIPDNIDVMIGHSGKRFLAHDSESGQPLYKTDAEKRELQSSTERNLLAARIAIKAGTRYLRVHNVPLHAELLREPLL